MAVFDLVQSVPKGNSGADTDGSPVSLPSAPTAGNLLLILAGQRGSSYTTLNVPAGWTVLAGADNSGAASYGLLLLGKISAGTETTVTFDNFDPANGAPESTVYAEFEYDSPDLPGVVDSSGTAFTDDATGTFGDVVMPALTRGLILAAQWKQPAAPDPGPQTLTGFAVVDDTEYAAFGNRHRLTVWYDVDTGSGGTYGGTLSSSGATEDDGVLLLVALESAPVDEGPPTVLPPWNPPGPGGPILEIYTRQPGSYEWGTAIWGPPSTWGTSGWQAITAESVTADVAWGTDEPDRGILAQSAAGVWTVLTYDPAGILDPGNDGSPFHPDVAPGTPIRLNHRGLTLRTGAIEKVEYEYAGGRPGVGRIRATDALSTLQAIVPAASVLDNGLYQRARDAIAAAGIDVIVTADGHDPLVADQLAGEHSAREHILDAATQRLYFCWIDRHNAVRFTPWGTPRDRGRLIEAPQLTGLRVILDDAGRYSVVRVRNADDTATVERAYTPTPRYGRRAYERSDPTVYPDEWAASVLADRAQPALRYRPGLVRPVTADDVDYYGTLEGNELVGILTDDVAVEGRILGGRIYVKWGRRNEPVWTFTFQVYVASDLYLVADWTGEPLVSDDDADDYLTPG